jgi:hypothetical protein
MGRLFRTFIEPEDHRAILIPAYHEIWPVICWVPPNTNLTDVQIQGRQTIGMVRQMWQDEELAQSSVLVALARDCHRRCS